MVKTIERGAHMAEKHERVTLRKRGQITVPKSMLHDLNIDEGDTLEARIENGKLVIVPTVEIPRDQSWWWTEEWQNEEKEVEKQIEEGSISNPMNVDDTLDALDDLTKGQ